MVVEVVLAVGVDERLILRTASSNSWSTLSISVMLVWPNSLATFDSSCSMVDLFAVTLTIFLTIEFTRVNGDSVEEGLERDVEDGEIVDTF